MTRWDKSLLAMVAACALTACSASHETARQVASTDSLQVESRWRLATTTVPESRVELAIPVATLRSLPAKYTDAERAEERLRGDEALPVRGDDSDRKPSLAKLLRRGVHRGVLDR